MKYINKKYHSFFKDNKLTDFQKVLSDKTLPWFEEPNIGRNGLSGVKKICLENNTKKFNIFIKVQENYFVNNKVSKILPFIKKTLVARREYNNIKRLEKYNIPTCEVLYFSANSNQALFITKELEEYQDLRAVLYNLQNSLFPKNDILKDIAKSLAMEIAKLHRTGYSHNCLYPKHIFINSQYKVAFIDFEKSKKSNFTSNFILRDLECLFYHVSEILNAQEKYCIDIKNNFSLKKLYYCFIKTYIKNYYNFNNQKLIKSKSIELFNKIYIRSLKKRKKYLKEI